MVWFHMLYDQIIRCSSGKSLFKICKPFILKMGIYCIKYSYFFIKNNIGIIRHTIWYIVLSFK